MNTYAVNDDTTTFTTTSSRIKQQLINLGAVLIETLSTEHKTLEPVFNQNAQIINYKDKPAAKLIKYKLTVASECLHDILLKLNDRGFFIEHI